MIPGVPTHPMSFTPKFTEILDKCDALIENGATTPEVQEFFFNSVKDLGARERINNLYRIRPKTPVPGSKSRYQFFKLNKIQDLLIDNLSNRNLVLKMRQGGITTFACIYALDKCLFEDGVNCAIMAHVRDNVQKFFRIIKNAFKCFQQDWASYYPVSTPSIDNRNELQIAETESTLIVCTETKGLTLDVLHISEACFVPDDRISESLESVPFSGVVIMESTPNVAAGMFYDIWNMWTKGETTAFKCHFFEWWHQYPEEPDFIHLKPSPEFVATDKEKFLMRTHELSIEHMVWRRMKVSEAGGDEGEFMRKYPEDAITCFLSGTQSVFPAGLLLSMKKKEKEPVFYGNIKLDAGKLTLKEQDEIANTKHFQGLRIWAQPNRLHVYAIGVDVAEGVGRDASCAQVYDVTNGTLAASFWANHIDVDNYAAELVKLGKYFNSAWLCVEQNNHGTAVLSKLGGSLNGLAYPNLYKRLVWDEFTEKRTNKLGFKTTRQTKPSIIEELKSALRDGEVVVQDPDTILELANFGRDAKTGQLGGIAGTHDDRVMALALAVHQGRQLKHLTTDFPEEAPVTYSDYDPHTGFPI